jgi:hypothetical protein
VIRAPLIPLLVALALGGCKRQLHEDVEGVWDDAPSAGQTEATANLSPDWPPPRRVLLDNGLLTFWLHEDAAVAFHARLLLPTTKSETSTLPAEQVAVVGEMLRDGLERRLARYDVTVEITHAPGRIEIAAHGSDDRALLILRGLGSALSLRDPSRSLLSARDRLTGERHEPAADELAVATLAGQLFGLDPSSQRIDADALARLDGRTATRAWDALTDPRDAVLIIHSGLTADETRAELGRVASSWTGSGRKKIERSAVARLRRGGAIPRSSARLLAEPPAPVRTVEAPGPAVMMLGRVIPTRDPTTRSLARLAQRLLQEELDARISIAGDHALFVVRVPLLGRAPDRSAEEAVDALSELARTRHQRQRVFQAAQLWLGARVVQASLDGEDWTALWSESIDLADADEDIRVALARDAHSMLEGDPDALKTWLSKWLDPRMGEPGWAWVVAGGDGTMERRLSRIAPVERAKPRAD